MPAGADYKAALQDVLQAFPYFQLAQVLFAKQMYDTHEPEATGRIKLASVYAPDRKAMYLLFKKAADKTEQESVKNIATDIAKIPEKSEVKYNFVYSSTSSEYIGGAPKTPKEESEQPSLSEAFLRKEMETPVPVQTPAKEPEKVAATIAPQKPEEKKPEPAKIQPFISVDTPVEKAIPAVEKKVEVKKTEVTYAPPPKKPYTAPAIEKKKTEPPPAKPILTVKPPVEKSAPVIEKKPEPPIVKPAIIAKPPVEKSAPVIEKKPEIKKPEPVSASGKKPYTKPTIAFKKNLYGGKPIEKKPEEPKAETPVVVKPPVVAVLPVKAPVIEEKLVEEKVEAPVIETPPVEAAKPLVIIEEKVIEAPKVEPVIETPTVEAYTSIAIIEEKVIEEPKVEVPIVIEESKPEPIIAVVEPVSPVNIEVPVIEEKIVEEEPVIVPVIEEEAAVVQEPITDNNLKYNFSSWLKVLPEISVAEKPEVKPVSQEQKLDIIEKFLKKESSISRPKAEFFSPVKAAKMSITEDDTIISETLANIYFIQGSLPKALKAYQTLLLRIPEKKNIFAPRIEKIKALMRENTKPGTK